MKEFVICKACGYISEKNAIKDACPACGAPAKVFETYTSRLSEERETKLARHLHPILVHFPMAFTISLFFLDILTLFTGGKLHDILLGGTHIMTVLLPFCVLAAGAAGMSDGKARFRKLTTKAMRYKLVLAVSLFVSTAVSAAIVILIPATIKITITLTVLALISLILASVLGIIGGKLLNSVLPDK